MDSAGQPYRLEVAVKRVYGLTPLLATTSSKIAVEVHFLDFPSIVIHPQGFAIGDAVTYNVCHKADFRMTAQQAASVFPAVCQCHLSADNDANLSKNAQWFCPCPLIVPSPDGGLSGGQQQQQPQRAYVNCVIRDPAGETLGYVEMSCVVVSFAPFQQPSPLPVASSHQMPSTPYASRPADAAAATPSPLRPPPSASPDTRKPAVESGQGKPYIVRVVVGESDRKRRGGGFDRREGEDDDIGSREVAPAHNGAGGGGRRSSPVRRVSANTASRESLLYVLQYDVAYQLQSLSETTAAVLQREHPVLTSTPLPSDGEDGTVNISKLTKSIDRSVAQMVKLANIVLQVVNQLIANNPAPPRTGASREIKEMARQKRNPVNKLPVPADGSVGHYLQYSVLYQLQCLGTNLAYVTLAYRDVLETPLSAIPKQHADFCFSLGDEVQHLTKLLNIFIQSTVDGTLGLSASPSAEAKAEDEEKKKSESKHRDDATPKDKPPARALSINEVKISRSSSSSGSDSSSSSSSFDASLNRPMTPVSATPAPAVVPVAIPSPNPVAPSPPPWHQQSAPPILAAPAPTLPSFPLQPQISTPPYATVTAARPVAVVATPATTESPPQESPNSFLSVPGAVPFSWVNTTSRDQRNASLSPPQPPLPTSVPPPTSGVHVATGIGFSTQPPVPRVAPPTLSAPQLPIAQPRPSLLSPLAPPTAISSPAARAAPTPAAIPIPVPIPR
ncbi:hypothetical protein ABB37_00582 [Leptomonas pyrrhocoris]|uniref:Uncharacterized protein n=1 Tax=Leptomonas pyrrhocoris TaxID=157538 RepID=A0A0M9GAQ6_LEPPY|nr:hypothetical protein ABB37_00582 [Leptomonas pyrrhocoris]KPA86403.1 hypothetical protein ABB37_00582 [Leptomonas pyrrhocoris]|eukprot:XP_015664842.1 hypothetical protein ABB37_00582 [Leptomonas pyrrhocoris]